MTTTHAPAGWIFVLFNSFIHTLMYFYYTLTCLGYRPTWKRILTTMQIIQFIIGNPLGLIYAIIPDFLPIEIIPPENIVGRLLGSQLRSLYACLFVNTLFITALIVLFTDFSRKTYGNGNGNGKVNDDSKKGSKSVKTIKAVKSVKTTVKSVNDDKPSKSKSTKSKSAKSTSESSIKHEKVKPSSKKEKKEEVEPVKTTTRRTRKAQ